jgi:biotin operon repressor
VHRGYIKLWRKTFDSGIGREHATFTLWMWILCNAARKPLKYIARGEQIQLETGELVVGRKKLSTELRISEQSVRTSLEHLKRWGNLTIRSTNRFSIVKVTNWETYQETETQINQQINQEVTSNQPALIKETRSREVKNKRINTLAPFSPEFESFWSQYPKRVKKRDAFAEWVKINPTNGTVEKIMEGLARWNASRQWAEDDGKYIPDPERFIKKRRWEDEIATAKERKVSYAPIN